MKKSVVLINNLQWQRFNSNNTLFNNNNYWCSDLAGKLSKSCQCTYLAINTVFCAAMLQMKLLEIYLNLNLTSPLRLCSGLKVLRKFQDPNHSQ